MISHKLLGVFALMTLLAAGSAHAQDWPGVWIKGDRIKDYGPVGQSPDFSPIPKDAVFKVAFDISKKGPRNQISKDIETVARFLNQLSQSGVPDDQVSAAIVVHGMAGLDLVTSERLGAPNPNEPLIAALINAGVRIELCGQTGVVREIAKEDLLPGVAMPISAMVAHAQLAAEGYTLNPF